MPGADRRELAARVHDRDDRAPVEQQARDRRRSPDLRLAVLRPRDDAAVLGRQLLARRRRSRSAAPVGERRASPLAASRRPRTAAASRWITAAVIAVAAPWPALGDSLERARRRAASGRRRDRPHRRLAGRRAAVHAVRAALPAAPARPRTDTFASGDREVDAVRRATTAASRPTARSSRTATTSSSCPTRSGARSRSARRSVTAAGDAARRRRERDQGRPGRRHERLLAWRWYWINGRLTTSNYLAKAYNALDKLTGRGDDSAVIVVTTPIDGADRRQGRGAASRRSSRRPNRRITARLAAIHDEARQ